MKASPLKRDKSKYYRFHQDHNFDIEHIKQLNDEIELLIHWGYLGKYIQNQSGHQAND